VPSPSLWLKLNDGTGTSCADSSGGGNPGTIVGAGYSWVTGPTGAANTAVQFNGVNNYITSAYLQSAAVTYTVCGWVKTTNAAAMSYVNNRGASGMSLSMFIGPQNYGGAGSVEFVVDGASTWFGDTANANAVNNGAWHHICGVFSGSSGVNPTSANFTIYVDGNAVASTFNTMAGLTAPPYTGSGLTYIGYESVLANYLTGAVSDFRAYNSALTAPQVLSVYQAGLPSSATTPQMMAFAFN